MTAKITSPEPKKPDKISRYAEECLLAVASQGLGRKLSLGGALGLAYYLPYRTTHDVDAWWDSGASESDKQAVVLCLENTLSSFGETRTRSWGDVVSVDLLIEGKAAFSFQVAGRDVQLERSGDAPWPDNLYLDSLRDLLAAKMKALVERGAPRDFRDIFAVWDAGIADPETCWQLWKERADRSGISPDPGRARLAVRTHLSRIELSRPLESIGESEERSRAERLRRWFRKEFLDALVD